MAHKIGLRVVAEGIETRIQSERLIEMDCDEQQGFYFSKPIPGDAVPGYLDSMQSERALSHAGIDQTVTCLIALSDRPG
jgi:EAL domain-containing protein (putative c-di-GMP-specific phosphodiesterase class I)